MHVEAIKLAGKKQNIDPMWKVLNKEVELGEPTSFLWIMYTWAALNVNAKQAKILWTNTEPCLNREFPWEELQSIHTLRIFKFLHGLL